MAELTAARLFLPISERRRERIEARRQSILRRHLEDNIEDMEGDDQINAMIALEDEDVFEMLYEQVERAADEDDSSDGPVIRFIKYIIENPEKFANFLNVIISLFSVTETDSDSGRVLTMKRC